MSAQVETDMDAFEAEMDRSPIHRWPSASPWRRSGSATVQPGDLALCGAVKVKAGGTWDEKKGSPGRVTCDGCLELIRAGL
jgi:hypothetical protein